MRGFNLGAPAGHHHLFPLHDLVHVDDNTSSGVSVSQRVHTDRPKDIGHPAPDGSPEHDAEVGEVIAVRNTIAAQRQWPSSYMARHDLPDELHASLTPARNLAIQRGAHPVDAAIELAAMDQPIDLCEHVNSWLLHNDYRPSIATEPARHDFVNNVAGVHACAAVAVHAALEAAFRAKWYYGRRRPVELIDGIEHSPNLTPRHPAYPAGHGAAAGATARVLLHLYQLDPTEGDGLEVYQACRQFAHLRTLLGVHWASDNDAGFDLGYTIAGRITHTHITRIAQQVANP